VPCPHEPRVSLQGQSDRGQPLKEQLWHDGLPVHPFNTSAQIIEALALALEQGQVRILPDPHELPAERESMPRTGSSVCSMHGQRSALEILAEDRPRRQHNNEHALDTD
jgi:hypothetical protein